MYDKVKNIHFEITNKCNASCPRCTRTQLVQNKNLNLDLVDFRLDKFIATVDQKILEYLDHFYMCGNLGDPAAAQDTIEIFEYIRRINPHIYLSIYSNGGIKTPEWWYRLAQVVDACIFSIDGLSDSNHLYRVGTDFNKIMANAAAFMSAQKAEAHWDFIRFKHNEHQVAEAQALAKQMGFKKFTLKETSRFTRIEKFKNFDSWPVVTKNGTYNLEPPTQTNKNTSWDQLNQIIDKYGGQKKYFSETPISCKALSTSSIYIDARGIVYPCCWVANSDVLFSDPALNDLRSQYEITDSEMTLGQRKLSEILEGYSYLTGISKSWAYGCTRSNTCVRNCSTDIDFFSSQKVPDEQYSAT